jgi:hypothetical protein
MSKRWTGYGWVFAAAGLWATAATWAQAPRPEQPAGSPVSAASVVTVPDGTAVEMRFAQPVRGKMLDPVDVGAEAMPGDRVRLVSAADVRVGDLIVIAEGAIAQASVLRVKRPLSSLKGTGLVLQFDWIEDVTGAQLPMRILPAGDPQPFMLKVTSTSAGVVARPETLRSDLAGRDAVDVPEIWRSKSYIPIGTRVTAYVHGAHALDSTKVEEAQDRVSFTQFETTADATIYRTKGHGGDRVRILVDGKLAGQIGEKQYLHLDLAPGEHSFQIESQAAQVIKVQMGREYYFHLRPRAGSWELKTVTTGEGEDSIADADPAVLR